MPSKSSLGDNIATLLTFETHRKLGSYSDLNALQAAMNFAFGL
jgi:hypothetical protein